MAKYARSPQLGARTSGYDMVPGAAAFKFGHDNRAEYTNLDISVSELVAPMLMRRKAPPLRRFNRERRLAVILATDVVGFSSPKASDAATMLDALKAHHSDIFDPAVEQPHGRIVMLMGDG